MTGPSFPRQITAATCAFAVLVLLASQAAFANAINVFVDTSGLNGQAGLLTFDLIDSSSASSSVTINNFSGDYTPDGSPALTGDASGNISTGFALADGQFFNEVAIPIVLGNSLGFDLNPSFGTPGPTEFPDELSVFLLTSDESASLISTGDPTGADSILDYFLDATGAPNLLTYNANDGSDVTVTIGSSGNNTVPEPSPLALVLVPLVALVILNRRPRKFESIPG